MLPPEHVGDAHGEGEHEERGELEARAPCLHGRRGYRSRPAGTKDRLQPLDGLRGLAVVAVVAYHLGFGWAKGGYLGVDSFLVLSGFLITSGLLREHARSGSVRLVAFWNRRVRRLVPALVVVLAAVAAYGAFLALPDEAHSLHLDGLSALGFVSNWRFVASSQGYFGQSAAPSLLRHTWSLGVEAQLYLLWAPIVAFLVVRRGRRAVGAAAAALAVASAGLAIALVPRAGVVDRAYYGTDTRAAAFLIGAAVACALVAPGSGRRLPIGLGGVAGGALTLVLWGTLAGTSLFLFRGGLVLSALSTAVVIVDAVRRPDGRLARALSAAPLCLLGRVSYGIYLWHWPLFLFLDHARTGLSGLALVGVRLSAVAVATSLSWVLLERPILRHEPVLRIPAGARPVAALAAVALLLVGLLAGVRGSPGIQLASAGAPLPAIARSSGRAALPAGAPPPLPGTGGRAAVPAVPAGAGAPDGPTGLPAPPPVAGAAPTVGPTRAVVLGDSVAYTLAQGLAAAERPYGVDLTNDAVVGCGVATGTGVRSIGIVSPVPGRCLAWEQMWQRDLDRDRPAVAVILLGRWELLDRVVGGVWQHVGEPAFDSYLTTQLGRAVAIAGSGGATVVLCTVPYFQGLESAAGDVFPEDQPLRAARFNQLVRQVVASHPGVVLFDLNALVSPNGRYASTIGGTVVRSSDGVHFSLAGGAFVAARLLPAVTRAATVGGQ